MKKYIFVLNAITLLGILKKGKRVEGVLFIDEETGCLSFKAYNRMPRVKRKRDRLIALLEHGWVKESTDRIKVYESVPKELGTPRVMTILDREHMAAKDALIDREIDEWV